MRILQIVRSALQPGGQSNTVHHLSETLAGRGHDVTILALARRSGDQESLLDTQPRLYQAERVSLPRTRGYLHDFLFTRAIRRLAVRGRFDLLHAHMLHPEGHCALQAARTTELPLVVTGHGEDIQVDPSCGYGVRLRPRIDARVRQVLDGADALVAISDSMKAQMIEAGARPERVSVVRWGWSLQAASDAPFENAGYIVSVGRFVPKKGYDLLLRAMKRVVAKHPEARLLIAGEGADRAELERLAHALGIEGHVRFLGFIDGPAKSRLYQDASIFVCPSRWEPLGLVNLEAMSCGLPVVAFRIDGIPEIVPDGRAGLLAPPQDFEALASAMGRLLWDLALRRRLSVAAREEAGKHRWENVGRLHEEIYQQVLARAVSAPCAA